MYNKITNKLLTLMNKVYGNKNEISLGLARKKGLNSSLKTIQKELNKLSKKETSSLYKEMESYYLNGYLDTADTTRKPIKKSKDKSRHPWSGMNAGQRISTHSTKYMRELTSGIENLIRKGASRASVIAFIVATGDKYSDRLATLYRTELWHMEREGVLDGMKYNKVKFIEYVTRRDNRVCPECQALEEYNDGIYPIEDAPILPRHPHCRCVHIPHEK